MRRFDPTYPQVALAALVLAVVLAVVVGASTSTAAFGAYNPQWDGASDLRTQAEAVGSDSAILRDTARYDTYDSAEASGTVAVILSPDRPYSANETERVRRFVERGGTLVVAEDFGRNTNPLLTALGTDSRIDGRPLRDERHFYRSPAMPVADNVTSGSQLTNVSMAGVSSVALNHGTVVAVNESNEVDVLVRSSEFAYLDENRNGTLDGEETLGRRPVVTAERVGAGRVVVVSDPSVLVNAMLDRPGNRAFVRALFAGADQVLLDYSHTERLPPLALAVLIVRESIALQLLATGVIVTGVALWARWPSVHRTRVGRWFARRLGRTPQVDPELDADAAIAFLERHHPEWDPERIERVARAQTRHQSREGERDR